MMRSERKITFSFPTFQDKYITQETVFMFIFNIQCVWNRGGLTTRKEGEFKNSDLPSLTKGLRTTCNHNYCYTDTIVKNVLVV